MDRLCGLFPNPVKAIVSIFIRLIQVCLFFILPPPHMPELFQGSGKGYEGQVGPFAAGKHRRQDSELDPSGGEGGKMLLWRKNIMVYYENTRI